MKKLFIALFTAGLCLSASVSAGAVLSLDDICSGKFRGDNLASVRPLPDGESYAQLSADGKSIEQYSFKTGRKTGELFSIANARGATFSSVDGYQLSPTGRHLLLQTNTHYVYRRSFTADFYLYDIQNHKVEPLSDGGPQQAPLFSPDGTMVAFVRENNIYLVKLLFNNSESPVTTDGRKNEIINGIPDWVYEEEFSTSSSMAFTADSRQLVYIRYDERNVPEFTMQHFGDDSAAGKPTANYPRPFTYKYPRAGENNSLVEVRSFDIKSRQTRTLDLPLEKDGYIPRIKTTADASKVAVVTMNRHQDCLRIYMANPLSTVCQMVIEEKAANYINEDLLSNLIFTDNHILLTSERDGYNHLYLYTINGQLKRRLTEGRFVVKEVYGYDEATGDAYFAANPSGPTEQQVMVAHANGKTEVLTPQAGVSSAVFSSNMAYFLRLWSSMQHPTTYALCTNKGKLLTTLIDNEALLKELTQYNLGEKKLFSFTTADGVELNGWMVLPKDFDSSRKYPVVMYQYSGPGSQQVLNRWAIGMNGQGAILEHYLAQQGYIAVCVDGRGTGGRGAEFEKCTYLHIGSTEAHDQVMTARWLAQQSYVDKSRIAIWGWSYGGFCTLMSMSEGTGEFCAGIAIAPVTSWRYYDSVYTERFMRTPQENAAGYDDNPVTRASRLSGNLLLCHGLADDNVHFQHTAVYTSQLVAHGKDFRQLTYTDKNHSILGYKTRLHLFSQCMRFFDDNMRDNR